MSSVAVAVADTDTDDPTPLLHDSSPYGDSASGDEEIAPSSSSNEPEPDGSSRPNSPVGSNQRLASLDVFRGLTVALMILVDDAGGAFPSINHSPWFGVTLADFVMPFFLFGVGVSIGLVFKKVTNKQSATKKVILRTIKLFLLGVVLQGGYFHGRNDLSYGVDVRKLRWLGVLQRISIGYLFASVLEIWLVNNIAVDSALTFVKRYCIQWTAAFLLVLVYMSLLSGLYVPDWNYEVLSTNTSSTSRYGSGTQILISDDNTNLYGLASRLCYRVHCGMRGSLEPACNAVGLVDRFILGVDHLYQHPVYRRTKILDQLIFPVQQECSVNSPDYGPLPQNSPEWCLAPFDPEGILRIDSIMELAELFRVYGHMQRVFLWSVSSFPLLISGYVLFVLGIPLSKPLYTLSYMCITAGASGFLLTIIFYIVKMDDLKVNHKMDDSVSALTFTTLVDVKHVKKPAMVLQWMGMNALIIYALGACDLFPAALQGLYWRSPENNLVDGTELLLQSMLHSRKWGTLAFVVLEILFWGLVAGFLNMKRFYVRL
ncbi:hypothetical protein RHSIM_Rhsim13G0006700 [Rhododendron simsii]|uniref:Heparan-alpha-glucosaminide N-acetyltransferase catalytic domain-containing protein n=1 Tax=Rhododendron simsii TaxID=118357 RepID=A0A834G644_RHOSS|nr:hypothetical protein RHSIM_Rhsim13G0006700 [Rhododendron simsii]